MQCVALAFSIVKYEDNTTIIPTATNYNYTHWSNRKHPDWKHHKWNLDPSSELLSQTM